jgi:U4/U6.U5 tri-snRNP-associated protein 3
MAKTKPSSPSKAAPPDEKPTPATKMEVDPPSEDAEDTALRKLMGFTRFKSTQNTKVPGNQIYGVRKEKKTEYRQYMNRVGGFNRPLSPGR